jgi:hypothetical protein
MFGPTASDVDGWTRVSLTVAAGAPGAIVYSVIRRKGQPDLNRATDAITKHQWLTQHPSKALPGDTRAALLRLTGQVLLGLAILAFRPLQTGDDPGAQMT